MEKIIFETTESTENNNSKNINSFSDEIPRIQWKCNPLLEYIIQDCVNSILSNNITNKPIPISPRSECCNSKTNNNTNSDEEYPTMY